jgi:hypothetical protein
MRVGDEAGRSRYEDFVPLRLIERRQADQPALQLSNERPFMGCIRGSATHHTCLIT